MSSVAADTLLATPASSRPMLDRKPSRSTIIAFLVLLLIGVGYTGYSLVNDIGGAMPHRMTMLSFLLLGLALLIALGFEFVNGFHDTANAVATVIYTHSLPPHVAVVYSGALNFFGVLVSSGAVAFGIVAFTPELDLAQMLPIAVVITVVARLAAFAALRAAARKER